jgi:hypothetical protein
MLTFDPDSHTYTLNGEKVPGITQIIADMGLIDTAWFTDYSRERGIFVHRIIQWHLSGELDEDTVDESLIGYLNAWKRFELDAGFVPTAIEAPLASELYRFAGTPDYIGRLNGCEAVIDAKSGMISPATGLQLAAQEILAGRPLKRFALQVMDTGKYKLTPYTSRSDRGIFLAAVSLWWWKQSNMKG